MPDMYKRTRKCRVQTAINELTVTHLKISRTILLSIIIKPERLLSSLSFNQDFLLLTLINEDSLQLRGRSHFIDWLAYNCKIKNVAFFIK